MRWVVGSAGVGYCCGNLAPHSRRFAMLYAVIKALLSGIVIAAASEVAKRSPAIGAIILSLPLISILALWVTPGCICTSRR